MGAGEFLTGRKRTKPNGDAQRFSVMQPTCLTMYSFKRLHETELKVLNAPSKRHNCAGCAFALHGYISHGWSRTVSYKRRTSHAAAHKRRIITSNSAFILSRILTDLRMCGPQLMCHYMRWIIPRTYRVFSQNVQSRALTKENR